MARSFLNFAGVASLAAERHRAGGAAGRVQHLVLQLLAAAGVRLPGDLVVVGDRRQVLARPLDRCRDRAEDVRDRLGAARAPRASPCPASLGGHQPRPGRAPTWSTAGRTARWPTTGSRSARRLRQLRVEEVRLRQCRQRQPVPGHHLHAPTAPATSWPRATPVKQVSRARTGSSRSRSPTPASSTWTADQRLRAVLRGVQLLGQAGRQPPGVHPDAVDRGAGPDGDGGRDRRRACRRASYAIDFDMYSGATGSSPVSFSVRGHPAVRDRPVRPAAAAGGHRRVPADRVRLADADQPQLSTAASTTASGTITYSFTLTCDPLPGQTCPRDA